MIPGQPVPLDPNRREADGVEERAADYLRRKLAEGRLHPARERLLKQELAELERAA